MHYYDGFKQYLETKTDQEVEETIKKLPASHRALTKGYKFKFEGGCNLKGYPDSIGLVQINDPKQKIVKIASPWNYGREFTMLHEIGHMVWNQLMTKELKEKWKIIAKKNPKRVKQDIEELFSHSYACHFANNKIEKHHHPEWEKFMTDFCKEQSSR